MPWNEPGNNSKNHDPWGNKKDQGPPALDKVFNDLINKLTHLFTGKKGGGSGSFTNNTQNTGIFIGIIFVALLIIWFLSGLFIVNPAEEAVLLRLGKFSSVAQPGLHWLPRFIDTKYLVDVKKIYSFSLQGDFLTKSSDQNDLPNQYIQVSLKKPLGASDQSKNLVNVELNVQYRIADAQAYLFNVVDPDATIKAVASGTLSDMVGQMKLDEVLTTGRETLSAGVLERIKKVMGPYNTGLEVIAVNLRKVQAPDQVRVAFSDVNRADQDKATYIQQAQAYASKVVPLAQGVAARIRADAMAYQQKIVLNAQANIAKYQALLKVYTQAPEVTRQRMYFETMQSVFQKTSKILIEGNNNNLLYLPLDKIIRNTKSSEVQKTSEASPISLNNDETNQASSVELRNDTH